MNAREKALRACAETYRDTDRIDCDTLAEQVKRILGNNVTFPNGFQHHPQAIIDGMRITLHRNEPGFNDYEDSFEEDGEDELYVRLPNGTHGSFDSLLQLGWIIERSQRGFFRRLFWPYIS